jgi:hypothetical protein
MAVIKLITAKRKTKKADRGSITKETAPIGSGKRKFLKKEVLPNRTGRELIETKEAPIPEKNTVIQPFNLFGAKIENIPPIKINPIPYR